MFGINELEKQVRDLKYEVETLKNLRDDFSSQNETIGLILDHLKLVKFTEPGKPAKKVLITKKEKEKRDKRDKKNTNQEVFYSMGYPSVSLEQQMAENAYINSLKGLFNK